MFPLQMCGEKGDNQAQNWGLWRIAECFQQRSLWTSRQIETEADQTLCILEKRTIYYSEKRSHSIIAIAKKRQKERKKERRKTVLGAGAKAFLVDGIKPAMETAVEENREQRQEKKGTQKSKQ